MTIEKLQPDTLDPAIFRVSRIFGAFYEIYSQDLGYKRAVLRGKLRLDKVDERNPITVGDYVLAEKKASSDFTILSRMKRNNFLVRRSEQGDSHVLCANVEYVGIIASLQDPETKTGFIDRSIAACYHAGITPLIIFTKKDLLQEEDVEIKTSLYKSLGYLVEPVSCHDPESIEHLKSMLADKTTYFVGISGSGKSTLINVLSGNEAQKVNTISGSTKKGRHTTTNSYLIPISPSTYLIDSPGIKEWGIFHIPRSIILESFPELAKVQPNCSESDCCQLSDGCEMLSLVSSGNMVLEREISVLSMLESLDRLHKVRTGNLKSGKFRGKK